MYKTVIFLKVPKPLNNVFCAIQNAHRKFSTSKTLDTNNHYNIIITGGGMVGTTLACSLGKEQRLKNQKILLLEGMGAKNWTLPEVYSNRVSSLNPGTIALLKKIGAWEHIEKARYANVKKMQVWDALSEAVITFNQENNEENVAFIVENDVLLNAVLEESKKIENVETVFEAKVKEYKLANHVKDVTEVELENGTKYTCDLLLGCDGANSQVRKAMGVHYLSWNYEQMGVVATLKLSEPTKNVVAWQRFLPTGPIAILPLNDNLSSLVWSTTPSQARILLKLPEDQFVDSVNDALWKIHNPNSIVSETTKFVDLLLNSINCPSSKDKQLPPNILDVQKNSRAAFPLGFGLSTNYVSKGVALVGDSAHRVHPLAGQGVNLGFGDVTSLTKCLGEAIYAGSSIDDLNYLKSYERERQLHNVPTMFAVDGLHRLYNTDFAPLVLLRSLGLQATHALNPFKKAIISHASS